MSSGPIENSLQGITPLGAGDLIDRAVRLYRKHFAALIMMAAPPVVAATLITVAWTFIARYLFRGSTADPIDNFAYYFFSWLGSLAIGFTESVATLTVMGGASRT